MTAAPLVSSSSHVLIVDDSPDELRLLVEMLRSKDYRLSIAFDGAQGYDRAIAGAPDLILLDVRMPRIDGFAVCRKLKANPVTTHIPVIFLSAARDVNERLVGLQSGGVDYILKPYSPEEVLARVQIHLALSRGSLAGEDEARMDPGNLDDDQVLVRAAQRYLADNLSNVPSLGCLSRSLGSNEKRLSRAFQKCLDMTVFEYLRQERMRTAQRLLTETSLSVVAISEEVGFSSAANFSTAFRDHAGISPSEFRRTVLLKSIMALRGAYHPNSCLSGS
jgi:DNA-binding response OmpR family regulator